MTGDRPTIGPAIGPEVTPIALPELLAPAGNWACAKAAVENGADAIYFGLGRFNARMRAENFTAADLPELVAFLHRRGVKGYVTLNTLVFSDELASAEQYLRSIIAAGVDAVIVQDVGICRLIRHLSPDFPIHGSTQMTITSAAGVEFAQTLGCHLVVLARECTLKEINKIRQQLAERAISLPLEVFVHGALCVAYSGQCLTSEALGGRSANRGECAQACRMPYELIADGEPVNLGDRRYLLSPQDLSGLDVLPELAQAGVTSLKIEGRLKSPEYVANVTQVYRQALDRLRAQAQPSLPELGPEPGAGLEPGPERGLEPGLEPEGPATSERYRLEMAFSRGIYSGWFRGINNQELVHARFGKKRGVYLGSVTLLGKDSVTLRLQAGVKPGDGVVFDCGHPEAPEEGGRIYGVELQGSPNAQGQLATLEFGRRDVDWRRVQVGDRLWKTSDPELDRCLRQSFTGDSPHWQRPIWLEVHGEVGQPLVAIARDQLGHVVQVESTMPLVQAHTKPLTPDRLQDQLGRLGNTPFYLQELTPHLTGQVMLPVSELNRMRRELVQQLEERRSQPPRWTLRPEASYRELRPAQAGTPPATPPTSAVELIVLARSLEQLQAAVDAGISTLYCELEDPRRYRDAVALVQRQTAATRPTLFVAPPRITKPLETWILQQVRSCGADGYLVRNYDQLEFFRGDRCRGDFSLNVANPITAQHFKQLGLERLTASYDLNIAQLEQLLQGCPAHWLEVTIHQHMPLFHMEHCVFCAFLSDGTDYTNCGRPCDTQTVKLRDRAGVEHVLQADAGCRNTVFNGTAQTGAEYWQRLLAAGVGHMRLEFLDESPAQVSQTIHSYQRLLRGEITGAQLWRSLRLQNRLGVTRGPLDH